MVPFFACPKCAYLSDSSAWYRWILYGGHGSTIALTMVSFHTALSKQLPRVSSRPRKCFNRRSSLPDWATGSKNPWSKTTLNFGSYLRQILATSQVTKQQRRTLKYGARNTRMTFKTIVLIPICVIYVLLALCIPSEKTFRFKFVYV